MRYVNRVFKKYLLAEDGNGLYVQSREDRFDHHDQSGLLKWTSILGDLKVITALLGGALFSSNARTSKLAE